MPRKEEIEHNKTKEIYEAKSANLFRIFRLLSPETSIVDLALVIVAKSTEYDKLSASRDSSSVCQVR